MVILIDVDTYIVSLSIYSLFVFFAAKYYIQSH